MANATHNPLGVEPRESAERHASQESHASQEDPTIQELPTSQEPVAAQKSRVPYRPATSIPSDADKQARQRVTYSSFGNDGVTASVNSYGNLMQITRYFGRESDHSSGFFCAEFSYVPCAYPYRASERLRDIISVSDDPDDGMYLQLERTALNDNKMPHMSFVYNRWPRFQQKNAGVDYTLQYLVDGETVYQIYTFQLHKIADGLPPFKASFNSIVRFLNIDFTKNDDGFEQQSGEQQPGKGHTEESSLDDCSSSDDDSLYDSLFDGDSTHITSVDQYSAKKEDLLDGEGSCIAFFWAKRKPVGLNGNVGLFLSAFVGGYPQETSHAYDHVFDIIIDDHTWNEAVQAGQLEITLAYTLKIFPLEYTPADLISPVTMKDYSAAKSLLGKPFHLRELSEDQHLNFILWRNIEHILSVCSIPVGHVEGTDDVMPVALTCGDISGHLVSTKASL